MINHEDRGAQDLTGDPTYCWETVVLSAYVIDNWSFTKPAIAGPERDSRHASPETIGSTVDQSCGRHAGANEQLTPDAAAEASRAASNKKKHVPTAKTYTIIQLIKCGLNNDEIKAKLPNETVGNIRTVRTRLKSHQYTL